MKTNDHSIQFLGTIQPFSLNEYTNADELSTPPNVATDTVDLDQREHSRNVLYRKPLKTVVTGRLIDN